MRRAPAGGRKTYQGSQEESLTCLCSQWGDWDGRGDMRVHTKVPDPLMLDFADMNRQEATENIARCRAIAAGCRRGSYVAALQALCPGGLAHCSCPQFRTMGANANQHIGQHLNQHLDAQSCFESHPPEFMCSALSGGARLLDKVSLSPDLND